MEINWHEPTPFSRMLAIVLFVGVIPVLSFFIGMQYQETRASTTAIQMYGFPSLLVSSASAAAALQPEAAAPNDTQSGN